MLSRPVRAGRRSIEGGLAQPAAFPLIGRVATNAALAIRIVATSQSTHSGAGDRQTIVIEITIEPMAMNLIGRGMAPVSRQARTGGPSFGWLSSQLSSFSDERAKHPAARMRSTVPGITG